MSNTGGKVIPFMRPLTGGGKHEPYALDAQFEMALVYLCAIKPRMWHRIGRHLDPDALAHAAAKLVTQAARAHAVETGQPPDSFTLINQRIARMEHDGKVTHEQREDVRAWVLLAIEEELPDEDAMAEAMKPVLQRRAHKDAARTMAQEIGKHDADMDRVVDIVEKARSIGADTGQVAQQVGVRSVAIVDAARAVSRLSTGILELDDVLEGGVPRGSECCFVADSGGGKSMALVHAAVHAALMGQRVHYLTLELPEAEIHARILANLYGEALSDVIHEASILAKLEARMLIHPSWFGTVLRLTVGWAAPKATTTTDVINLVRDIEKEIGEPVDVLVIDYMDKIKPVKMKAIEHSNTYAAMGDVYETIRVWGEREQKWIYTASQSQRQKSGKRSKLDIGDIADSMEKVRAADQIITINPEDEEFALINLFVAKNRRGVSRKTVGPIQTDFAHGRIVVAHPSQYQIP